MMVGPASGDGEIEFVAARALEMPAVVLDRLLEHVERVGAGRSLI